MNILPPSPSSPLPPDAHKHKEFVPANSADSTQILKQQRTAEYNIFIFNMLTFLVRITFFKYVISLLHITITLLIIIGQMWPMPLYITAGHTSHIFT